MIWESSYWKSDLLKQSSVLKKRMAQKRWTDTSYAKCEQSIMIGFYSVRKLIESKKLTDVVSDSTYQLRTFAPTGKKVTLLNHHRIEELYDFAKPNRQCLKLSFLCNQVVHSYVFSLVFEKDMFSAVLVASDHQRSKALIEIPVPKIIEAFEMVGNDEVSHQRLKLDPNKGDYFVENFR